MARPLKKNFFAASLGLREGDSKNNCIKNCWKIIHPTQKNITKKTGRIVHRSGKLDCNRCTDFK